ncbi:MAG: UbiA-like protein EboC [Bacteroidota bacterium]
MNPVLKGYLQLARPANLPTAAADILAGIALSGALANGTARPQLLYSLLLLVLSSILLYAGGVVLNDVCDAELDNVERPERPIPSGRVPLYHAMWYGAILLIFGVTAAVWVGGLSGLIALVLAILIVAYDAFSKKYGFLGPLNMGICRALNLLLGMSILGELPLWWIAGIPLTYIFAITLISRGEVHGENKNHIIWAGVVYILVILGVMVSIINKPGAMQAVPFLALFAFLIFKPLIKAYRYNSPKNIKKAVIAGVLSLIVLDAAFASGLSVWWYGLLIVLLLPLSLLLSKLFAVT